MTTAKPKNSGIEPTRSATATMSPHTAIVTGLATTARTEVRIATAAPTSRSSNSGNDTTLLTSTKTASSNPTAFPTTISVDPRWVVRISRTHGVTDSGDAD